MARKLQVEIVGDASSLQRAFGKAGASGNSLSRSIGRMGRVVAAGVAVAGAGAVALGGKMVSLASDAAEVQSKLEVVFGKQLPKLTKNLDAFSEATGASRYELRQQAADMGALLRPLTGSTEAAAAMSEQFVKLAGDLGSFNNVPTADALLAIRSGLVGQSEPLLRFGVVLNEAKVQAEGLRLGLIKQGETMTDLQKVQARTSLIMKGTTLAQGDATRTADSMANQMKRLRSSVRDVATDMGTVLVPAAQKVVSGLNDFVTKIQEAEGVSGKLRVVVGTVTGLISSLAVGLVNAAINTDWGAVGAAIRDGVMGALSRAWRGSSSAQTAMGFQGLEGPLQGGLKQTVDRIDWSVTGRRIIQGIADGLKDTAVLAQRVADTVMDSMRKIDWALVGRIVGPGLATAIVVAFTTLLDPAFWVENWDLALAVAATVFRARIAAFAGKLLKAAVAPLVRIGGNMVSALAKAIESFSPRLAQAFSTVVGFAVTALAASFRGLWAGVLRAAKDVWALLPKLLQRIAVVGFVAAIAAAINGAVNAVTSGATRLWAAASTLATGIVSRIVEILTRLPGSVTAEIGKLASALAAAGAAAAGAAAKVAVDIVAGVVGGLRGLAGAVADVLGAAASTAVAAVSRIGEGVVRGVVEIRAEVGKLAGAIASVGTTIYDAAVGIGEGIVRGVGAGLAGLAGSVTTAVQGIAAAVGSLATQLVPSQDAMIAIWRKIQAAIQGFLNWFKQTFLSGVLAVVGAVTAIWTQFGADLVRIVTAGFNQVRTVVAGVLGEITGVVRRLVGVLRVDWSEAWNAIKDIPGRALREAAGVIRGLAGTFLTAATAIGTAVVTGVTTGLNTLLGKVKEKLDLIQGAISTVAGQAAGWAAQIGQQIISGVLSGLGGLFNAVKNKIEGILKSALGSLNPFSSVEHGGRIHIGQPIMEGAIKGILENAARLSSTVSDKVRTAVEAAAQAVKDKRSAFADAWSGYSSAALAVFDDIASKVKTKSEQMLETMRATRARTEVTVAVTEARTGLATAQETGDPAAIVAAQKTLDDALYRQKEFGLEQRALLERAKFDEQNAVNRSRFEQWLASRSIQQQQEVVKEGKGQADIIAKIQSYNPLYKARGLELGNNLAAGLLDARGGVRDAAQALADEIARALGVGAALGKSAAVISINALATGGIVTRPTFAMIGESGPEAVVPLDKGGFGGTVINVTLNAPNYVGEKEELLSVVREGLIRGGRYNGGGMLGNAV